MKLILGAIAIATSLAAVNGANASCLQGYMFGVWSAYAVGLNFSGPFSVRCTLTLDQSGKVIPAYSACIQSGGQNAGATGNITLISSGMCAFNGVIYTGGSTAEITQATLTENGQVAIGVGTLSHGAFAFSMAKVH